MSWETYQRLLAEHQDVSGTHFIYDEGNLEIMVTSARHEQPKCTLEVLINVLAEEFDLDVHQVGSMTFQREDLQKGFEPDSAFYIARALEVEGREVDPAVDPPPDLIIEVDGTSPSLPRLPIFAAFGVPEVWRYDGSRVAIYRLESGRHVETTSSLPLPPLTADLATRFLKECQQMPRGRPSFSVVCPARLYRTAIRATIISCLNSAKLDWRFSRSASQACHAVNPGSRGTQLGCESQVFLVTAFGQRSFQSREHGHFAGATRRARCTASSSM